MQVNVCLEAILIPECLDFHSGYSAPRSRFSCNLFRNIFLFRNIPNERALNESNRWQIWEFNVTSRSILPNPSFRAFTRRKDHSRRFVVGLRQWKLQGSWREKMVKFPFHCRRTAFSFQYPVYGGSIMSTFPLCLKSRCLTKNFLSNLSLPLGWGDGRPLLTTFCSLKNLSVKWFIDYLILVFRSLWQRTAKSYCVLW